jgi:PAS domain S-box-containing protein
MAITRYEDGMFLYVNDAFVRMFGYSREELIGKTVLSLGLYVDPAQRPAYRQLATEGKVRDLDLKWRTKSGEIVDLVVSSTRVELLGEDCLLGAGIDVTARKAAEERLARSLEEMRTVTGRLMRAQDDERRRIAQLMHETSAQELAALKMLLAELNRRLADAPAADRSLVGEMMDLAERSIGGIRSLSYLLHPPLLDEVGLVSAIRWYADGFAQRSGIAIRLDLPAAFPRFPQDVETTLFRVVQEALINVHRHANSATGDIRLSADVQALTLEIADQGAGISEEVLAHVRSGGAVGVGLAGMRQRLEQLGGTLDIASDTQGTIIRAQLPLPRGTG